MLNCYIKKSLGGEKVSEITKDKVFIVSDVHGNINMFEKMLENWNPNTQQLVILGDLGDRGPNSKACFMKANELVKEHGAMCFKGNHEDMLINYLRDPQKHAPLYMLNGGYQTMSSLLDRDVSKAKPEDIAEEIKEENAWLLPFLDSLILKYEWGDFVLVHAGVNLTLDDWKDSKPHDYVWIREGFLDQKNSFDKTFIFGHTVTATLHNKPNDFSIWGSGDGKIGIDGGAVYGGQLNGLLIDKHNILETYVVSS